MDCTEMKKEWERLAPAWIREAREGANPTRTALLDKPVLEECGNVTGLNVIDIGCGEGRFCRILVSCGAASVLGIDLCRPMIEAAKTSPYPGTDYRIGDAQNLESIADGAYDLAVSYLNQCDLPDFRANNREVFRILKPGGRFVVANLHPMRSAVGGWHRSESGEKLHVILDNYFDEGVRRWKIMDVDLTNFHRSLQSYINGFLAAGFALRRIVEPTVDAEMVTLFPNLSDELRVPNFIIFTLEKPR